MEEETENLVSKNGYNMKKEARNIVFGKYEMGRILGQGTFTKVYYRKNLATQESVAVKVMKNDEVKKQGLMEQLETEISVMQLVRHPNIVELREVMATKTMIFFVMEYVWNDGLLHMQCGTPAYVALEVLRKKKGTMEPINSKPMDS
ncbi:hypothetical protein QYF36_025718 [Acer negundo]|nr:hypothetical protein QYF36_025718 [Acer negundo]